MKIRVSIINYANTIPFVYGLHNSKYINEYSDFFYHYPSQGFRSLQNDNIDISILPVASIPLVDNAHVITEYGIGSYIKVDSVILYSKVPIDQIQEIRLDYQSQSSNKLVKVLAVDVWGINPEYLSGAALYDTQSIDQAKIIIGDRALETQVNYKYKIDLAEEWNKAYSLPFVFARWVANKEIPTEYLEEFNKALQFGVDHIDNAILNHKLTYDFDIHDYLTNKICYEMTDNHKQAQQLFYKKIKQYSL